MGKSGGFWELERVNRRRTWALVVKFILVLAALGLALDFLFHNLRISDGRLAGIPWITEAAALLAVLQALRANFSGAELVLDAMGADPISSDDPKNQTVIDVVREMALAARIPQPRVDVIDDPSPNAFAIGRDPEHSAICVTQGLVDEMDREELQGVIGHEIAHIRDYDTQLTTLVTAMFRGFGMLRFIFGVPAIWKASPASGGIVSRIIATVLSREREYLADASAVELTRNPKAVIRALEHIARTERPLRCATRGTAQLFIVDPFEVAGGATSYRQYINQITRIRLQPGKTQEQRDEEARKFAANEFPRNMLVQKVSSHPPLGERIERLQALIGALPASDTTDDQLRAKFSDSAAFVQNLANTDPEIMAKMLQAAVEGGKRLLQVNIGEPQIHQESTSRDPLEQIRQMLGQASGGSELEDEDSSLPPAVAAAPGRAKGTGPLDSAAKEELEREDLASFLAPAAESMRRQKAPTHPAAAERPSGARGLYLFWFVIVFSAVAIVASFAIR